MQIFVINYSGVVTDYISRRSGEVTPIPVEPMGPMRSKNMNGF